MIDDRLSLFYKTRDRLTILRSNQKLQHLVDLLDETDVETAAQASYAYWLASLSSDRPPTDDQRHRMATREARRHLCKTDNDRTALKALKETCNYRRVCTPFCK